jgi:hypothetical protein
LILEQLYRQAVQQGHQESFCEAIARAFSSTGPSALLDAWGYRLNILPLGESIQADKRIQSAQTHLWVTAISMSILSGIIWSILAGGKPPLPFPNQAAPLFWLGWAPITALLIVAFLLAAGGVRDQARTLTVAGLAIGAISFLFGWMAWGRKDAVPFLTAFHLPFLTWIIVGAAMTLRLPNRAAQRMSFILKSAEALVTGGIYLAGTGILGLLTLGIFNVLGIHFTEDWISRCAALALGVVPILAVASIYDPRLSPAQQNFFNGPAPLMRLLTRLLLTPALGVLAVYVLWFIPRYFLRPFEERAVLIVYNATLAAVLLLIVLAIPNLNEELSAFWLKSLRHAITAMSFLALVLNFYALSAAISRTVRYGISPNRHAIIGWNVVTLFMLGSIMVSQIRASASDWAEHFRESFGRFLPLVAFFALWVLLASSWIR